jgi:hypothetical protein
LACNKDQVCCLAEVYLALDLPFLVILEG